MKNVASTDGVPVDHGDNRFGDLANEAVNTCDLEAWGSLFVNVSAFPPDLHVPPHAEVAALARPDYDSDLRIGPRIEQGGLDFFQRLRAKGVENIGTVDSKESDALPALINDVLETAFHDLLPESFFTISQGLRFTISSQKRPS
jgi:hypothetical protein